MTHPGDIRALPFARQLLATLPPEDAGERCPMVSDHASHDGISYRARRAWRHEGGRRVLSGGALIMADVPSSQYAAPFRSYERRLRPGWTEEQFLRAFVSLWLETHKEQARRRALEVLIGELETELARRVVGASDEEFDALVTAERDRSGRPDGYYEMTEEDARHWIAWAQSFPLKPTD